MKYCPDTDGGGIRGDLQEVALSSLLQAIHVERASAVLSIEGGGKIHISEGEIVAASTGKIHGYPAILELLSRRSGSFRCTKTTVAPAPPLAPMMSVILESARLDDEWRRIADRAVVINDPSALSKVDGCMPALMQWIDGYRTIAELQHLGAGTRAVLLESIKEGLACGGISLRPTTHRLKPVPGSENDQSFDELIDLARARIRAGDLEDAERLFHRALDRRPSDTIARQNLRRVAALMSSRRLGREPKKPRRRQG